MMHVSIMLCELRELNAVGLKKNENRKLLKTIKINLYISLMCVRTWFSVVFGSFSVLSHTH